MSLSTCVSRGSGSSCGRGEYPERFVREPLRGLDSFDGTGVPSKRSHLKDCLMQRRHAALVLKPQGYVSEIENHVKIDLRIYTGIWFTQRVDEIELDEVVCDGAIRDKELVNDGVLREKELTNILVDVLSSQSINVQWFYMKSSSGLYKSKNIQLRYLTNSLLSSGLNYPLVSPVKILNFTLWVLGKVKYEDTKYGRNES
ncbi:hypothetical protein Syun_003831 [Stephania yunnanensis]|uniref:Uncharacterized protein n=1 Tax=Stephania yunnanensis TaxID=152371 RepID=A0AAP0L5V0_9MAGN